jgi:hypothetical protein
VAAEVVELLVAEGFAGGAGLGEEELQPGALCSAAQGAAAAPGASSGSPWQRLEALLRGVTPARALAGASGTHAESDGLCAYVYRHVQRVLGAPRRGQALAPAHLPLPFVAGRNSDFREAVLEVGAEALAWLRESLARGGPEAVAGLWQAASGSGSGGEGGGGGSGGEGSACASAATVRLSFFLAYGFRNIQGILARLKKRATGGSSDGASVSAYVEIMACPKGCTNGGGLVKEAEGGGSAKAAALLQASLAPAAAAGQQQQQQPEAHDPHRVRQRLLELEPALAASLLRLLHTQYHNIPPLEGQAAGLVAAQKW